MTISKMDVTHWTVWLKPPASIAGTMLYLTALAYLLMGAFWVMEVFL